MNRFIQTFISQMCLEINNCNILNICICRYTVFIYIKYGDANVILTFSYNSVEKMVNRVMLYSDTIKFINTNKLKCDSITIK